MKKMVIPLVIAESVICTALIANSGSDEEK